VSVWSAKFGIALVPFSYCIQYYDSGNIVLNLLYILNCNIYPINWWVDGRQYVDVVSRYLVYLRGHPDVPGRVVVRVGDSCLGSSVVHPPYVAQAWARSRRR